MNEPMSAELALSNIIDIAKERCSAEGHECDWECSLLDRSITVANNTKVISHWCQPADGVHRWRCRSSEMPHQRQALGSVLTVRLPRPDRERRAP